MKNVIFLLFLLLAFIIIDLNQIFDLLIPSKKNNEIDVIFEGFRDIEKVRETKTVEDEIDPLNFFDYNVSNRFIKIKLNGNKDNEESEEKKIYRLDLDELEKVFPDIIQRNKSKKKVINYNKLVPYLIRSVQEQSSIAKRNNEDNIKLIHHIGALQNELKIYNQRTNNY